MITQTNLYLIAVIPPEPIYFYVRENQQLIAGKYLAKEALKPPPHITLIPPFKINRGKENELLHFMDSFGSTHSSFDLSIDGFDSFGVGVIYAALERNESLKKMQKDLTKSFYKNFTIIEGKGPNYRFHPHITVAYRDLTPQMYSLAWEEYSQKIYRCQWGLNSICLLRHNYNEWEIIKRVELKGEGIGETMELGF